MSSNKREILLNELNDLGIYDMQIYLYERIMGNYSSWILCCGINSIKTLENKWEDIVDCFAVYFQANLVLEIERSNLYLIFFFENEIPNQLKMIIEYDKYSCRKIIINEAYPKSDGDIEKKIDSLIFNIGEYQEDIEMKTLNTWLAKNEPNIFEIYTKFKNRDIKIEDAFSEYNNI